MIPIFSVVLISDKDENVINNGKYAVLFHLSKYFDKLHGNFVYKMQIEMSSFIQVPTSLVFATISEFWFSGFIRLTIYNLITALTAKLIKINNKKVDQKTSKLLTLRKCFTCSLNLFCTCGTFDGDYKLSIIFQQVDVYFIEPIKIDVLIKLANQEIKRRTRYSTTTFIFESKK